MLTLNEVAPTGRSLRTRQWHLGFASRLITGTKRASVAWEHLAPVAPTPSGLIQPDMDPGDDPGRSTDMTTDIDTVVIDDEIDTTDFYEAVVPYTFFDDHEDRGLVCFSGKMGWNDALRRYDRPYILSRKKNKVTVLLHEDDIWDLASDAYHYASSGPSVYEGMIGLCSSARATLLALHDQGIIEELAKPDTGLTRYVDSLVRQRDLTRRRRAARKAV